MSRAAAAALKLLSGAKTGSPKSPSAYILFGNELRATAEIALVNPKERMSAIATKWKSVDPATKTRLETQALELKAVSKPSDTRGASFPSAMKFKSEDDFNAKLAKVTDAAVFDFMQMLATSPAGKLKVPGGGGSVTTEFAESGQMTITWKPPKKVTE